MRLHDNVRSSFPYEKSLDQLSRIATKGFQNGMILQKNKSFKGLGKVHGLARELLVFFPI